MMSAPICLMNCQGQNCLNWGGWTKLDLTAFLDRVNRGDRSGTRNDGCAKDLAIVLWGAASRGVNRAVIIDQQRVLVLVRDPAWRIEAYAQIFEDPFEQVWKAMRLLAPAA